MGATRLGRYQAWYESRLLTQMNIMLIVSATDAAHDISVCASEVPRRTSPPSESPGVVIGEDHTESGASIQVDSVDDAGVSDDFLLGLGSPESSVELTTNASSSPETPNSLIARGNLISPEGAEKLPWPLESPFEASLLKYFLTTLSPWFDYCDPYQHFRTYIGNNAATEITLLYAALAVSARHQSTSLNWQSHVADEYQKRCLRSLIAALNDQETALPDTILASAAILRFFEEMTETPEDSTRTHHMLSAQLLLRITEGHVFRSSFTDAVFLVVLRSEIYVANLTQRPIGNLADHCNIDTSLEPTSERMWALRAIAHVAKVTNLAYGEGAVNPTQNHHWECLMQYIEDWERLCPESFRPIYSQKQISPDNPFPQLYYANDYHVAARQHIELARVLLLASCPQSCLSRIQQRRRGRSNNDRIRDSARIICGVAMSNPEFTQALVGAGLVIAICGELFDDPAETTLLFQILSEAESHLGWPCLKAKEYLRGLWRV
ncbi:hypothetical protein ANOM_008730 [Aspergillus nomiae NRRL 13137]|uniref:Zn(II)2Cys6 transcription factor n=1 Tax=Aspergillus nomiae NRRL (strain ATCC 15546 / NRRL 13137 / CBS 260.88 / M93) TaxID=1509407 RepID=A0A0L1IUX0_ASPN3|nr:uncharacterized protein ANOM_008730 [Aspergillus nomiae NRRL 13137]KNG83297.1 hypothetical protein ANOM_008730 [Aspergillus nomiae NRRL 13137]